MFRAYNQTSPPTTTQKARPHKKGWCVAFFNIKIFVNCLYLGLVLFSQVLPIKNLTACLCYKLPRKPQNIDLLHGRFYHFTKKKMDEKNLISYKWAFIYHSEKDGKFYILDWGKTRRATADTLEEAKSKINEEDDNCCLDYCGEDSFFWQMTN